MEKELTAEQIDYMVLLGDKLATKYQELNARIQRAISIVRSGAVRLDGPDAALVHNGGSEPYLVTSEGCGCEDFTRGNAPRGMCKHRLAVYILRETLKPSDEGAGNDVSESQPVELAAVQAQKSQVPYSYPEPKFWIKGGRRTVSAEERQTIDGLHKEAESRCRAAYDALPPDVWACIVLLPRNQKVAGKDDVFVSLRNPYLNVAGRLMLLRAKRQPKEITTEFFTLGERTLCKAVVKVGQCSATGTAEVIEGASGPTSTNPYEVAETSAIGRALGNLGIGLIGGVASADEVMNARARQTESTPAGMEQAA